MTTCEQVTCEHKHGASFGCPACVRRVRAAFPEFPLQVTRDTKTKPGPVSVPWVVAERAWAAYSQIYGRDQSVERLAERGGFDWAEMDRLFPGWREATDAWKRLESELNSAQQDLARVREQNCTLTAQIAESRERVATLEARLEQVGIAVQLGAEHDAVTRDAAQEQVRDLSRELDSVLARVERLEAGLADAVQQLRAAAVLAAGQTSSEPVKVQPPAPHPALVTSTPAAVLWRAAWDARAHLHNGRVGDAIATLSKALEATTAPGAVTFEMKLEARGFQRPRDWPDGGTSSVTSLTERQEPDSTSMVAEAQEGRPT